MRPAAVRGAAAVACFCLGLAAPLPASPLEVGIDLPAIRDAVRLGMSQDEARLADFHAGYRVSIGDPVLRQLEIVSEFRRVVQMSEERSRLRDVTWDASRAERELRPTRGLVDLVLFLQFSPRNTYRSMPAYSLLIYQRGPRAAALEPVDSRTQQSYVSGQPAPPGTPILGATVQASFDAARLDPAGQYLVAILLDGREIRRVPIDLRALR